MGRRLSLARVPAVAALMVMLSLSSSFCVSSSAARAVARPGAAEQLQRHPVVLIPGAGGNQLEARLTEGYEPSSLVCRVWPLVRGRGGWFRLWFDPSVLVAPLTRCLTERMTLSYDANADDDEVFTGVLDATFPTAFNDDSTDSNDIEGFYAWADAEDTEAAPPASSPLP